MIIGHKKQWEFLKKKFESNQLSHAYLFAGAKEIGKKTFAIEFAKLVSCLASPKPSAEAGLGEPAKISAEQKSQAGKEKPCGKCINCQMIEKGSFPDFKIVTNKEDKNEIEISQIREVQNFLSYKSYYGSFKIVVVDDAEKMNQEAQSCFLKTLEEPKGETLLILITSKPDMLLPTIISRCQTIKFFKPKDLPKNPERLEKEREILNDLLPVISSDFAQKFKYVKSISAKGGSASGGDYSNHDVLEIMEIMQKYLRHLLLVKIGIEKPENKEGSFKKYSVNDLKKILNLVEDISKKLTFTNASPKLALEILLMEM